MRMIRSWIEAIIVFFLFIGCTLIFYYGILWVSEEYKDYHRYDEPKGKAVKVVQQNNDNGSSHSSLSRLHLFLLNGE